MKILLLGEFSGLHRNLKAGLQFHGHEVHLVSWGDGFKKIFGDINPPALPKKKFSSRVSFRWQYFKFLKNFSGYDIVQIMGPNVFLEKYFPYVYILETLKKNNKKVFLLAAGSDAFFWQNARPMMRYGPFDDVLEYDTKSNFIIYQSKSTFKFNKKIADLVHGVIPVSHEYFISYQDQKNILETIPLPIDASSIKFTPNEPKQPIKVFHGLSRYGFKGTRHVEAAFAQVNDNYPDVFSCRVGGHLPLNEYLSVLEASNIIVDQVNSYSYGMNALYAMALGKVVIGNCEPECLRALGIKCSPLINVLPNKDDIVCKLLALKSPSHVKMISAESRRYVEKYHCARLIAGRYIETWMRG